MTVLPSRVTVTSDIFFVELKGLKEMTSSLLMLATAFSPMRKAIMARSVELPPMISCPETVAELFTPMPVTMSVRITRGRSFSLVKMRWLPVASSTTDRRPSVMVPVLSVKSRDREPAVSRPLILRTRTLSLIMRMDWKDMRMLVSMGRPSGTAQMMIVTATVTASMTSLSQLSQLWTQTVPFRPKTLMPMTASTMAAAPT